MGTCTTAGGGEWDDVGREVDIGVLTGQLPVSELEIVANDQADKTVLTDIKESQRSGSTGTIALLHSLDEPTQPYFAAKKVHLTIGHCG